MQISANFTGGNITVIRQDDAAVYLENQLRDSAEDWFYWAFCIEGAEGKTVNFHMQPHRLGYWGPAVSHDLKTWHWLNHTNENSFQYHFGDTEHKVYFAHSMLYHPTRFFELTQELSIDSVELCKSRKGKSVPACLIGNGKKSMVLTARHHACESTGSFVLEGVLRELVKHPIADTKILCVPFVDFDGVVDGDQGKGRYPHDHNRDYLGHDSIYPETSAIQKYVAQNGCNYGFDFHSPWHKFGENDTAFIVRNSIKKLYKTERFSKLLEQGISEKSFKYFSKNDHPLMEGWNKPGPSFGYTMMHRPECNLAHSFECAYFGTEDNRITDEKLVELGKCYAKAITSYIKSEPYER